MLGYALATIVASVSFLYCFVLPVIEYFRDPKGLRRFPALDSFAGITNISFMIQSHRGFRSKKLAELHKQHPVIRTGPKSLSFGDAQAIKVRWVHFHHLQSNKLTRNRIFTATTQNVQRMGNTSSRQELTIISPMLSIKAIMVVSARSSQRLMHSRIWKSGNSKSQIKRLVSSNTSICCASIPGTTVDYRAWTNFFSLDAIADIGLSKRLGFLDVGHDGCISEKPDGTISEVNFRECLYAVARGQSGIVWSYDWYKTLVKITNLISPWYRHLWRLNDGWDGIVLHLAKERLQRYNTGEKLDDFFTSLMQDKSGRPQSLEWGEIVAEVSIMMNAGSTTTAIAMANVMYQLLRNPNCMERLRGEIDAVLQPDEVVVPYEKVRHLPYLRACLDESMRLYPPTAHGLPRITPPEGWSIRGDLIAGGTTVSISAFVAHRDEKIFPEAEVYNPERWLGEEGKALQPYFVAFSAGARGCIGRNISYLEQTVLLASVLHRYEFQLPHPNWEPERRETMNLHLGSMPLVVRKREIETQE